MSLKSESVSHEFEDLVNKRMIELEKQKKEIMEETIRKAKKLQRNYLIVEIILQLVGFTIISYQLGGWVVLGLVLVLFGNNLSIHRVIYQGKNIWKTIWQL